MHKNIKLFIRTSLACVAVLALATIAAANSAPAADTSFTSKDIIMVLFGLLQTVFMGIGVWLISNDRELFTRLRLVEADQQSRDTLCDERHGKKNGG